MEHSFSKIPVTTSVFGWSDNPFFIKPLCSSLAQAKGLAFVDANAKMVELNSASGLQYDGVKYSAKFVTGGTFSLDGVHLTGRGYAIVANEFLKAINTKYKSNLPMVSPNSYSGVTFP